MSEPPKRLILMYHAILAGALEAEMSGSEMAYAVDREDFIRQLAMLSAAGAEPIGMAAAIAGRPAAGECPIAAGPDNGYHVPPRIRVLLTFDDSWAEHVRVAAPVLAESGWPAAFFLTVGEIGRPGRLDWAGVAQLAAAGFELGAHGLSHRFLTGLSDAELETELRTAREILEQRLGRPVRQLSLPGGRGDERVYAAARRCGYESIFGSRPGWWRRDEMPLARLAVRRGAAGNGLIAELARDADATVRRQRRRAERLAGLRRLLGDGLYARLHGWLNPG